MGYAEKSKDRNRHGEFVKSIFVDISEEFKPEKMEETAETLEELLGCIFDDEE